MKKIKTIVLEYYKFFKSKKDFYPVLFLNLLFICIITLFLVIIFFSFFMPIYTRHGQKILVPDLDKKSYEEAKEILKSYHLRIKIKDNDSYNPDLPPNYILSQTPKPDTSVKKNRTIYVSLNALIPPMIEMPNLLNGTLRNAQLILKTNGLKLGSVKYVIDIAKDCILEQNFDGKEIEEGQMISKGSKIDLVVGAGLGSTKIDAPDLIGKSLEEAEIITNKLRLKIGTKIYPNTVDNYDENDAIHILKEKEDHKLETKLDNSEEINRPKENYIIKKQKPDAGERIRVGSVIDIWLE